jgi:hypothetical protein
MKGKRKESPMAAKKDRAATPRSAPRKARKPAENPVAAVDKPARANLTPEELRKLVSEAAYFRAKQRGFTPGHEVEDWVQAEAEVRKRIGPR